ncbi:MAG TPA: LysR substrate-binding domain-containing protein [Solirubrobacteraceae bacterium]|jgi:DNA-binding transcriptional LysR family regulator|nr:LysR substrate-binding domain-containing protein [Solirubrobacteraceae bacterium]
MAVTLTQLSAFLAVVRRGSVTAAAGELVVTQPSVSAAVSALERELGVQLTERIGRGLAPTAAGRAYFPYAADVLGLLERGASAAREASGVERARLRVSAVTTAGEQLAPLLVHAFRERRPEFDVSLDVGNRATVFRRLTDHLVDVAITGRVPEGAGLVGEPFANNEIVLITSPEDPLARRRWVAIEELSARPWLVREEGSGTRVMSEEFLAGHGVAPELVTLGSNGAIRAAARAGLGVALISRAAVELELEHRLLGTIRVRGGLPKRSWYVVRSAAGPVPEAVAQFTQFLQSAAARRVSSA